MRYGSLSSGNKAGFWGVLAIAVFMFATQVRAGYLWPLEGKVWLNSSFAECRPNHFHAGIDIHAKTGTPLRAIEDGYIWHVAVNPFGYGKSLFLRLQDGRTLVYAHLHRYASKVEQIVELEQQRRFSYMVSLYFPEQRFPVTKGEVVGYAGSTGAMGAHLHFEIRDEQNRPVDPLTLGYRVQDTTPPVIKGILLTPLDDGSLIGGQPFPLLLRTNGVGSYETISDTISFYGNIGLAIHSEDYQDEWPFRLNISRSMLYVNGEEVFNARYDRFSYAHTREVELEFDYFMYEQGLGRFHRLYRYGSNHLLFYKRDDGTLSAEELKKINEIKVICYDSNGNVSVLLLYLRKEEQPLKSGTFALRSPYVQGEGIFIYRNMVAVCIRSKGGPVIAKATNAEPLFGDPVRCGDYVIAHFRLKPKRSGTCSLEIKREGEEELVCFPYGCVERDTTGWFESSDGAFRVRIPKGQLYEDLYARIRTTDAEIPEQLKIIRGPYLIEPLRTIFKKEMEVFFSYPKKVSKRIGIYMLKKDGWIYLDNRYDSQQMSFATTSRHMGTFALMEDTTAPEIVDFVTEKDGDEICGVAFIVKDGAGTGFKMSDIGLSLDGKQYIPALEPFQDEVRFLLFGKRFTEGGHTASITVTDQAGNRGSRSVSF
jgi:hypothetical protein